MNKILLKISGELLSTKGEAINLARADKIAREIKSLVARKIKVAVVVGAGNIMRGRRVKHVAVDRVTLDYAGMTAAVVNGLVLKAALDGQKVKTVLDSTLNISQVGMYHRPERSRQDYEDGKVLIMGGTGLPYITTDTAAVVFALELEVDLLLKATKVNGVYEKDPLKYRSAKKFDKITHQEVLERGLEVMDQAAFALAKENNLPVRIFKWQANTLLKAARGENIGSLIIN